MHTIFRIYVFCAIISTLIYLKEPMSAAWIIPIIFLSAVYPIGVGIAYSVRMAQLNSYKIGKQILWTKNNKHKIFNMHNIIPVILIILIYISDNISDMFVGLDDGVLYIPLILCLSIYYVVITLKGEKKADVGKLTPRVRRLIFTISLLIFAFVGLLLALSLLLHGVWSEAKAFALLAAFMFIIYALRFVFVVGALFINMPLEKYIHKRFMARATAKLRSIQNINIVAVTGSYGKTSTKFILNDILSTKYNSLMTPESYNTPMGICKTILDNLSATHELFVCEMGATKKGDISELCGMVEPNIGIITSVGPQHLESFKTIENVVKTKFELADSIFASGGTLFLNYDNEYIRNFKYSGKFFSYGCESADVDYRAENISVDSSGLKFEFVCKSGKRVPFRTKILGEHNVSNIVAAVAVADYMGIEPASLKPTISMLSPVPHRLQLVNWSRGITIIDDAFNSNPIGAKMALKTLKLFDGYRVLITPGMVELGSVQFDENMKFGEYASDCCDYVVLIGKERTEPIATGLKKCGFNNIYVVESTKAAIQHLSSLGREDIYALIENDLPDNY